MEEIWMNACRSLEISDDIARPWYERIRKKMVQGSGRFYHNWDELLLRKGDYLREVSSNVLFAVFFQYYEFDGKRNCVEKNCEAFDEFCSDAGLKDAAMAKIVRKLLGDESIEPMPGTEEEANLLQDLDLLVLGSPLEEYKRYRELLRKEYSHLDDDSYKQMRLKVSAPSPSTSREAIRATSTASPVTTTRQIKTFTKFKDDKFKTRTKKLFTQSNGKQMYFGCSPSQQISRKILRTIKRKMNLNSSKNHTLTKCRQTNRYSVCDLTVKEVAQNAEKSNATGDNGKDHDDDDDDDDDCVLIDAAPPEIILIDDESVAICDASDVENISDLNISNISHLGNNRNLVLRTYQPIGSASNYRRNQINFGETLHSTPKQILNDSTICPEPPCYIKTMSMIVEERSKRSKTRSGKAVDKSTPSSISITEPEDDSVIFVSEEMQKPAVIAADYISLATATEKYPISAQPREPREVRQLREPKEPRSKRVRHELFTSMEQKELQQYNDNAYNPNKDTPTTATPKRMVIVDGSNVAYHHALNKEFSVKGLQICLEYFEKLGHEVKAVVPQFRLQKLKSTNPIALEKLHEEGKIVLTPCKNLPGKSSSSYDDRFILQLAAELDAAIVSNDNYRDLIHENPAFKKIIENRVVGFSWCNDMFILPKDPYGKWGPALTTILNRS